MTNSGAYPADFQAPKSLDGWGTQHNACVDGDVCCDGHMAKFYDSARRLQPSRSPILPIRSRRVRSERCHR
jgi:hypothetical protein